MAVNIPSVEIISENDYKKVEVLGLLPTDRDPSAWLRMVARVFAAYKGVDVTKSISAYIDGFHILNDLDDIKNHEPGYYTFIIEKGACFIDDQFIGFKENVLVKFPKLQFLPGHEYWLVLQYNWLMQADYPLAKFEVIPPDLFVEGEMLKIRGFRITTAGEIELLPDDLDDQFAENFKKIFDLAAEKVVDSIESMKFQYLSFEPEEEKIDPSCKSGDFVYLDYISGKYKPARSCTKRLDKAVGIYLKDITNNKDYVIHSGFVDFSNSRWYIHPDRIYLKNLEPGAEYYLADNCIIRDTANPFYDDTLQMESVDPGKISTKFYPGLVRVGYAVGYSQMYIQLDYTSEIDVQNILELFGDKERFDIRYQDYYKYYALLAEQQFIIDYLTKENSLVSDLINTINELSNEISQQEITFSNSYLNYISSQDSLNNLIDNFDISNDLLSIHMRYSYNIQYNLIENVFNDDYFSALGKIAYNLKTQLYDLNDEIDTIVNNNKSANYENSKNDSNDNKIGINIDNFQVDVQDTHDMAQLLYDLIAKPTTVVYNDFNISTDSLIVKFNSYKNKNVATSTMINYLKSFYDKDNESGYLVTIEDQLKTIIQNFNTDFEPISYYIFDTTNVSNFTFTFSIDKIQHTYYKIENDINQTLIFNETQLNNDIATNTNTLVSGTDYISNSTTDTISGSYTASDLINNYTKTTAYDKLRMIYEKSMFAIYELFRIIEFLKQGITRLIEKLTSYSNTENIIDVISTFEENITTALDNFNTKKQDFSEKHQDLQIQTIKLFTLRKQKDTLNQVLAKLNQNVEDYNARLIELNNLITQYQTALGKDLDFNIPTKSIFMISNYQRVLYNYTYITNRLKIKYNERKIVEDRIEIARNARTEVLSKVPVNKALDEQLQYIIASYEALLNEINNEITTLTDEYNKIRTTYLGLDPIAHDDPNFDDGGYAVFDLDCLDTVE